MKRSNAVARRVCWLVIVAAVTILSSFARANPASQKQAPAAALTIVDQDGRLVPNATPSDTSQIFDVTVGPSGNRVFMPSTVNIAVGDTVRWTWASGNHSVTSGSSCSANSQFCSPNDMNCPSGNTSNTGTVYQHTFAQAGTFSYFCSAHCSQGMVGTINVAPGCTLPPSNMVGWYPGDGTTRDIQNGNNGALVGGTTFAAGMVGQAFSLNGTDAYVQAPANSAQDPTTAGSQDAWVRLNQLPSASHTMEIIGKGGSGTDFDLQADTDNRFRFFVAAGNQVASTTVIQTGVWYHVAGTWDATGLRMYVNGALENTNTIQNLTRGQSNNPLQIGNQPTFGPRLFDGLIDEVEIFSRALTGQEITNIASAGSAGKCKPPQPTSAFSRKTHGGTGTFDIDLNPNGTPGIECRSGVSGVYQMIVQFPSLVTVAGATLTGSGSVSGFSVSGTIVTIDLSNVTNVQTLVVKLTSVSDGTLSGDVPVAMSVLLGDTNGNGAVSASDVAQTKAQSGQGTTAANFRTDVNASGSISAADIALVKSKSGTILP